MEIAGQVCVEINSYLIDGEVSHRSPSGGRLSPHDLRGLRTADLPNALSLSIYEPKSSFSQLSFFHLEKLDDESQASVGVDLTFYDWHLPKNLRDFADDYRVALLNVVTNVVGVTIDQHEAGYTLKCSVTVLPSSDLFALYGRLAEEVLTAYRQTLAELVRPTKQVEVGSPTDAHGPRWWIRYVVVPILGSGAVAVGVTAVLTFMR